MGLIAILALASLVAIGAWKFATDADKRREYLAEWHRAPWRTTLVLVVVSLILAFAVCVFVPPIGMVVVRLDRERWHLWSLVGIALAVATVVSIVAYVVDEQLRERDRKRRRGR